ncbi:MAG: shikimate kinase [Proteobacteria bacterium]|nr:shikimate kinase [Pseudomonadota bacterium]
MATGMSEDIRRSVAGMLNRPIALIGLMGAGKTRFGRVLADALGLDFLDSDMEIEKAAGMSVADIFDRFGEAYFRDGERRVTKRLLDQDVCVIATGGGAIMDPETAEDVWSKTVSIWVRAPMSVMIERTGRNDRRPLLRKGDPEKVLERLAEARYPIYQKADIIVDSDSGSVDAVLLQALEKLYSFLLSRKDASGPEEERI